MRKIAVFFFVIITCVTGWSQQTFPRNDVRDKRSEAYAFANADIVTMAGEKIVGGTLLIKEGVIEKVSAGNEIPEGYMVMDLTGKTIYPSFIDMHTHYGIPEVKGSPGGGFNSREIISPQTKGAYSSNDAIKSHYNASDEWKPDEKTAAGWRAAGFGTVLSFRADGIARGTGSVVTLGSQSANEEMIRAQASAHYSFSKGTSRQTYPGSMMGYISLLRQTYLDARWYAAQDDRPFVDQSLLRWNTTQDHPQIFEANSWINILRANKIADEFDVQYIIKGGGNEYQRIKEVQKTGAALVIPLNFPNAYDVEDPFDAERVSLEDMLHWELAPTNPRVLAEAGIVFAITTEGQKKPGELMAKIRKAIDHGWTKEDALSALTTTPATLLQIDDMVGSIEAGRLANFLITSGDIFDKGTVIYENWIQGERFQLTSSYKADHAGIYELQMGVNRYKVEIQGKAGANKVILALDDTTQIDVRAEWTKDLVNYFFKMPDEEGSTRLTGWKTSTGWKGQGKSATGETLSWTMTKQKDAESGTTDKPKDKESAAPLGEVIYPFMAYGTPILPESKDLIIKNATVWTSEDEGILYNTDVLVQHGKIVKIGDNLKSGKAEIIDGTGMHLTAGIIDEHTHIAGGGNDRATNSAMVRIGDQINSEDINIYRSLSGGVTAAQVLHGSANPIGGQSGIIKLRWGKAPEDLKVKGAAGFIKFALGENVKRSRNAASIRYPQTRMGVEQVYVDAFTNAREYEKEQKKFEALGTQDKQKAIAPRRDLSLEALVEILNKERFITCHSYVQSEINMLMKVAEKFDFNINTFTHILEGYKVADIMREHGAAASSFSDWWNYKWEVRYAIPYNAAILEREGVLTAINSDDANMGRRLNQEAAKSIKYGGLSEEEAIKLVTLNPAKMLHLDDRMGSIKVGKDADLVLWTDHPLSVYARAQKTIVDGIIYFDVEDDAQRRVDLQKERARLIQKMIDEKKSGKPMQKARGKEHMLIHCESILGEENHHSH